MFALWTTSSTCVPGYSPQQREVQEPGQIKVMDYWEQNLRNEAGPLTSLQYFKPAYMTCPDHMLFGGQKGGIHLKYQRPLCNARC